MANLIDWNAMQHKCKAYIGESDYAKSERSAFTHVVLEYQLDLSSEEISDSITDGAQDRGIDAVYVDERDGCNDIHLFQFKYVSEFKKAKNNFPSNEIDKVLTFVAELLNKEPGLIPSCNSMLGAKVQQMWDALANPNPAFHVHFCGNCEAMVDDQQARLAASLAPYHSFTVHHHSLESLVRDFLETKRPRLDADIKAVDKNYFERTDGKIRGLICTFEANEIVKLVANPDNPAEVRPDAFDDNVRIYLTKKNSVNRKILETALSDENSEFWYLNNGITITCDSFSYQPGERGPTIALKNFQIVNGGQTSNALFEAHAQDKTKLSDVLVLARIYQTQDHDITSKIAEATNSQTPIKTRDLHSNDEIQKKLEEAFSDNGLYYERKSRQHSDQPKSSRIDALEAAQALLAYLGGLPEVAKKDRGRIFRDLYSTVFNAETTHEKLLVALRVYEEIQKQKRDLQRKLRAKEEVDASLLFLIDGGYHVLFAVNELCLAEEISPLDQSQAIKQIPSAMTIVKRAVAKEMKADRGFTTNRYFKDPRTKRDIQRAVVGFSAKKKSAKKKSAKKKSAKKKSAKKKSAKKKSAKKKSAKE
ncbi:AIPR protein [Posidoniimonas corsicana]|uniref:AIPR protein n=1 Tax=Posidoniimonas corsicana TaxID=1938618 RepID=A0A5C5VAL9_9BACT|nr:AIPR family protein [Posidoniimonas corsicana]TWT35598.1 AIPR protein [Posidoniimonas corsicana]